MTNGSVPDDVIYQKSSLCKNMKETKQINQPEVPFQLISDQSWLLTDYKEDITSDQIVFNDAIKKLQIIGDNTTIRLKGRWRILTKKMELNHKLVPSLFQACCILHNFLENREEYLIDWNFYSSSSNEKSITWYAQNNETNSVREVLNKFLNQI